MKKLLGVAAFAAAMILGARLMYDSRRPSIVPSPADRLSLRDSFSEGRPYTGYPEDGVRSPTGPNGFSFGVFYVYESARNGHKGFYASSGDKTYFYKFPKLAAEVHSMGPTSPLYSHNFFQIPFPDGKKLWITYSLEQGERMGSVAYGELPDPGIKYIKLTPQKVDHAEASAQHSSISDPLKAAAASKLSKKKMRSTKIEDLKTTKTALP